MDGEGGRGGKKQASLIYHPQGPSFLVATAHCFIIFLPIPYGGGGRPAGVYCQGLLNL